MTKLLIPEFVMFIYQSLTHAGYQAYVVGGAVRDACLQRPITDWDMATSAPAHEIKRVFHDIRHFSLKHDTVTLMDSGHKFEVTTFRRGKNSIRDDLACRDFTINAMAFDVEKNKILDPWGGKDDISQRLVRAVGNPHARFEEDPLRLLRAVRFATELGFRIQEETLQILAGMACMLNSVAPERIREELIKLLLSPRPSSGFNLMVKTGLLKYILPELLEGYRKRQNSHHLYTIFKHIMKTIDIVKPLPVLRLTALFHDIAKPRVRKKIDGEWRFYGHEEASARLAEAIMVRLRFSKDMIQKVTNLITHHMISYESGWSDAAIRRLIQRVGLEQIMDLLVFRRADILAHGPITDNLELLDELEARIKAQIKAPIATKTHDLAVDGRKVMEILGLSQGPEVGKVLKELIEKVTDYPELNTQKRLMAILEQMKGK